MFRDGGLGERKFIDDMTAHPRLVLGQHAKNPDAHWVRDRLGEGGQLLIRTGSVRRDTLHERLRVFRRAAQRCIEE